MTQQPATDAPEPVEGEPGWARDEPRVDSESPDPVRTGVDRVDDVIRSVEELEERPIEEHAGVFESAQAQLRGALDDADDADPASGPLEHA